MKQLLFGIVLAASPLCWGTPYSVCTTGTSETLAAVNSNTPSGCYIDDKVFSLYSSSAAASTANLYITGDNAPAYGGNTLSPLQIDYNSGHGTTWTAAPGATSTYSWNDLVTIDTNPSDIPTVQNPATPGDFWALSVLGAGGASLSHFSDTTGNSVILTMNFCLGGGTLSANGGPITGCSAADLGSISITDIVGTYNPPNPHDVCTLGGATVACTTTGESPTLNITSAGSFQTVTVQDVLAISDAAASTNNLGNTKFMNEFDEQGMAGVPEPGSFALVGTALLGVVAALRKKRAR
jgi:hypothetical protein